MKPLRRFFRRLFAWRRTRADEARLQAEIEEHLALLTADYLRSGLPPAEARRQAALRFGGVEAMRQEYRDGRGLPLLETLLQDGRLALRRLRKSPGFTAASVLTLALGIGAATSIFTLVDAVILRSLEVANPGQLLRLGREARCCYQGGYSQDKEFSLVSYQLYQQFRDRTRGLVELAAFPAFQFQFGVRRAGAPEAAQTYPGEFVTGNYFAMFGLQPGAGRLLAPRDDRPGAPPAAVMSYRLWQQTYGSDRSVIGGVFNFNDRPFTVVGIAPPGFFGDTLRNPPPDFFLPLTTEPIVESDTDLHQYDLNWLELIGRMRPGAAPAAIEAEMRVELKQWLRSHWGEMGPNDRAAFPQQTLYLRPGGAGITAMRDQYERWLQILMMASGFVLLIVCANVANLVLVRGLEQRRQVSLSMALGARPLRLVRQALTECILLSLAGGAAGIAAAFGTTRLIVHFAFPTEGGMAPIPIDALPSLPVLAFAFAVSLAAGAVFGIAPAWMATRVDPIEALRGASRSTARAGSLTRRTLVICQAALALVLLSASGLLTAALYRIENIDFGFEQDGRTVVQTNPRLAGYKSRDLPPLYQRVQRSLADIPGVSAIALCTYSPLSGGVWGFPVWADGHPSPGPKEDSLAFYDRVTPGFFDVIGDPILRGRGISSLDTAATRHVAVINEAFARQFFHHEDPIGKYFGRVEGNPREYEVVGIARDARFLAMGLDRPVGAFFFLPEAQHDVSPVGDRREDDPGTHYLKDIVMAIAPGARPSTARIRQAVASADPNLPVLAIHSLREQVAGQFRQQRLIARLTSLFGLLSLVLASIGLYGVTSYNAGRRTSEVGVRMALGAGRNDVIRLVLRGAFGMVVVGLCIGLPLALAACRFLGNQLYGMSPYHPAAMLGSALAIGLSAFAAALIPALRASRISPLEALREE